MPDLMPPRLEGDERVTLHALLQFHRESVVRKLTGIDEDAARRSPVASGTTLLWLVKHLSFAESLWIEHRFARAGGELPANEVSPEDTIDTVTAAYRDTWTRVDRIAASSGLDETCRAIGDGTQVNLRWVLAHLLEETARHAGHADILRELIDGDTGR